MDVNRIKPGIYYVGVCDRTKPLFEGLWPLPRGVSYNAYLVVDDRVALIDTVDASFTDAFLASVQRRVGDRKVDYLVVDHVEPDHSASILAVRRLWPDVTVVGNRQTLRMIEGYYGRMRCMEVADGQRLALGHRTLCFHLTPMIHWPETMVTHAEEDRVLFTGDIFGTFGAPAGIVTDVHTPLSYYEEEMRRYYSNIVGRYGDAVQRALPKIEALDFDTLCPAHGPVWQRQAADVVRMYDAMSRYRADRGVVIAYGSMYGNNERAAEHLARMLGGAGVRDIRMHNLSTSHLSYVLADIFRFDSLVVGAPTCNGDLFPPVRWLLDEIAVRRIPGRRFGVFGSYSWAGCAVRRICSWAAEMNWPLAAAPVEFSHAYDADGQQSAMQGLCDALS